MSKELVGAHVERFISQETTAEETLQHGRYDLAQFDAELSVEDLENRVPPEQIPQIREHYTRLMQAALRRTLYKYTTQEGEQAFAIKYLMSQGVGINTPEEAQQYLKEAREALLTEDIDPLAQEDDEMIAGKESALILDLMDAIVQEQEEGLALIEVHVQDLKPILIEQAIQAQELEKERYRDSMTGLLNKDGVERRYQIEVSKLQGDEQLMVVMFDINNFKPINDEIGHETGDMILKQLAEKITMGLRTTDVIARTGGDEFLLLLPTTEEGITALQEKLAEIVNGVIYTDAGGTSEHITVSAGITLVASGERPKFEDSLTRSDFAASISKIKQGSNTTTNTLVVYNETLKSDIRTQLDAPESRSEFAKDVVIRKNKRTVDSIKQRKKQAIVVGADSTIISKFDNLIERQQRKQEDLVSEELDEIELAQAGYGRGLYAQIYS